MTRMTGPDYYAVMCNLINIHTYIHTVSKAIILPYSKPRGYRSRHLCHS